MRTLFLQAPSHHGFDGGTGSHHQARGETTRRLREAVEFFAFLRQRRGVEH